MVTVEFTGVGFKPIASPLVPLPQPERKVSPMKVTASSTKSGKPRRLFKPKRQRATASAVAGMNGRKLGGEVAACALALMVS